MLPQLLLDVLEEALDDLRVLLRTTDVQFEDLAEFRVRVFVTHQQLQFGQLRDGDVAPGDLHVLVEADDDVTHLGRVDRFAEEALNGLAVAGRDAVATQQDGTHSVSSVVGAVVELPVPAGQHFGLPFVPGNDLLGRIRRHPSWEEDLCPVVVADGIPGVVLLAGGEQFGDPGRHAVRGVAEDFVTQPIDAVGHFALLCRMVVEE